MKVGSAVLGMHIAAIAAFTLTQGCVTTESQGSGRGAGARHRGIVKHEHKGNTKSTPSVAVDSFYQQSEQDSAYDPVIIESQSSSSMPEPYIAPVPVSNSERYIVQKGDILSRLASDFDTTTKTLISMNNLSNPDVLYVGQELRVPVGSSRSSSRSTSSSSYSSVKKGGEYVIQKGDTLSGIAVAAGVSLSDLRSLNQIQGDRIIAGETLAIPRGGKIPSNTQKSKPKKAEKVPVDPTPEMAEPAPAPMASVEPIETGSMQVDAVIDHVVYPGETIDDISRQYSVSKSDIMRLNNISDVAAVKEGQRLRIPIAE